MCNAGKVFFESCGRPVLDAWRESAAGPGNGASQIVLVYGPSKQIFSAFIGADMRLHKPLPVSQTAADQQPSIFKIAGEYWNFASFISGQRWDVHHAKPSGNTPRAGASTSRPILGAATSRPQAATCAISGRESFRTPIWAKTASPTPRPPIASRPTASACSTP